MVNSSAVLVLGRVLSTNGEETIKSQLYPSSLSEVYFTVGAPGPNVNLVVCAKFDPVSMYGA